MLLKILPSKGSMELGEKIDIGVLSHTKSFCTQSLDRQDENGCAHNVFSKKHHGKSF